MYRTGDPRFRRRLDEIGQTLESAQETAQTGLYQFHQTYVKPCFESVSQCFTSCVEASCPNLNLTANQRERHRRQREQGRRRGRAERNFDFYDDWDEEENDALMGWGNDEFDRLLAGDAGYGTITHAQPGRRRGMSYPKGRRKSAVDVGPDPTVIPGSSLFGKLFGGKALRYKPSAADLQENPGARMSGQGVTEGEALLREGGEGTRRKHRRMRSGTVTSGHTTDSLSSRGDIFPSDEEDDAIPLDDEFAMVLERRTTLSGPETESSSGHTLSTGQQRQGKRPSTGSRLSTHSSHRRSRSSTINSAPQTPTDDGTQTFEDGIPPISELKQEERELAEQEEAEVERRRQEAQKLAGERGLAEDGSSKEVTPEVRTPILEPVSRHDEPSAMTTPLATDDEADAKSAEKLARVVLT